MPKNWTQLSKQDAGTVIGKIRNPRDAELFSKDTTQVYTRILPFYSNYKLYRLENYATMPVFSMLGLGNDNELLTLDTTPTPIYVANGKSPVILDETTVIPYLDFFFGNVEGLDGEIYIIKDAKSLPALDSVGDAQKQAVMKRYRPLTVERKEEDLIVKGTLYYDGVLVAATLRVAPDGIISFVEQHRLLAGLSLPPLAEPPEWLGD